MKHLKLFLEYNSYTKNKIDSILDKIGKDGINALTAEEKAFLDAQKSGEDASDKALNQLQNKENEVTYKSDDGRFSFDYKKSIDYTGKGEGIRHYGVIHLPDMVTGDGEEISGDIEGYITEHPVLGTVSTHFDKQGYTDFDFVEGLEYEYDDFTVYIIGVIPTLT